jgi:phage gp36-like protein
LRIENLKIGKNLKIKNMFLTLKELKTAIYAYQLDQITNTDDDIVNVAIDAAVSEMKAYLRIRYDVEKIFGAAGSDRNALVMELCKNIAVWYVARLCNVDMIYSHVKERYDRAIDWLKQTALGTIAPDLPLRETVAGQPQTRFRFSSHPKFNHMYE